MYRKFFIFTTNEKIFNQTKLYKVKDKVSKIDKRQLFLAILNHKAILKIKSI